MSENTSELNSQLRDAESKVRAAEAALKDVKGRRLQLSIWSAIGGFLLFAVGGHWFPGYQLDSTAEATSHNIAASSVSEVMVELCAERFMKTSGFESRLEALKDTSGEWAKASYIQDGTWADAPGGAKSDHSTAEKCMSLIAERVSGASGKTS
jgi:hypothetical protein